MLKHPLDTSIILKKKHSIKRDLLSKQDLLIKNIAILGGSTTSEIKNILELFLLDIGIKANFYESEYNKFYEEAVFANAKLEEFKPDVIYVHTTNLNIMTLPEANDSIEDVDKIFVAEEQKFLRIWNSLSKYNCAIIQNNFELPQTRIFGNFDFYDYRGAVNYITRLNNFFARESSARSNLYINDINYISASIGLNNWFDKNLWLAYKYAVGYESIPILTKSISAIIGAIYGKSKKCLILDLDNTCWGGVIGDDGLSGISIGKETPVAEAYTEFQKYIKTLKIRGVAIAVCSKNEKTNAVEGFSHPDSILCVDDFVAFEANWEPKNKNITKISQTINLGMDSFVFIDDNPAEREIIISTLPTISVPNIGDDVTRFIEHIDKNYFFETVGLSSDDLQRNDYYKKNVKRIEEEQSCGSYEDYLLALNMVAEIKDFNQLYLDRITQLVNKTNQFNLTTKRYSMAELDFISKNENYIALYGRLEDKFGDNGLISVVIGRIENNECHVDLWLMSCRVLKRNMEFAMLDCLVEKCRNKGLSKIVGYYCRTQKNQLVSDLYSTFGFSEIDRTENSSVWELDIEQYDQKNISIRINTI